MRSRPWPEPYFFVRAVKISPLVLSVWSRRYWQLSRHSHSLLN